MTEVGIDRFSDKPTTEVEMSDTHDSRRTDDDVDRMGARTVLEERSYESDVRPAGITRTVSSGERRDRVRWGPVWAGLVVALAVNVLLQLALVATGALGLDVEGTQVVDGAILSAIAALVALFVGGLVTGASSMWRHASDGVFHGIVMWSLAVVAILLLSVLGSGLALGAATNVANELGIGDTDIEQATEDIEAQDVSERAQSAAGNVLLALGLTVAAAAAGGAAGAKMWPPKNSREAGRDIDLTERTR